MCHLVLVMPVLALPIFWLMPLNSALPTYAVIVLISAFLYWPITKAMRKPVQDGFQSLVGTEGEVVSKLTSTHSAQYLIRSQGELWSGYSNDTLQPGEQVNIVATKGIGVLVEPANKYQDEPDEIKAKLSRARRKQQCH